MTDLQNSTTPPLAYSECYAQVFIGDCLEQHKHIKSGSVDLVVTDPPYKLTQGGCKSQAINGHFKGKDRKATTEAKNGKVFTNNEIEFKDWMPIVFDKLKQTGHFYCMCNAKNLQGVLNAGTNCGFIIQTVLVWEKGMHTPSQYYLPNVEFIVLFRKGNAKYINNMGTKALIKVKGLRNKTHPSEKPIELMKILIENSSNENNIVFDPFMGLGSTGIACKNTNRSFIGIEKDEAYFKIAEQRINARTLFS
jgi:site-specific DNA-methyltransferase (adenine-specific)